MAEIATRVFAYDGTKNFLRLYNEEFIRPISPFTWSTTRVRVGVLCAITNTGGNLATTQLFVGMCAGRSPFTSVNTVHAIGMYQNGTLTYNAGSGNPYYIPSAPYGVKRVNGVNNLANAASWTTPAIVATTGAVARRSAILVDITPWNTVNMIAINAANIALDMPPTDFVQAVEDSTGIYNTNYAMTAYPQSPGGVSTTPLDTVNIYWSNGLAPLEVHAICVYRYNF